MRMGRRCNAADIFTCAGGKFMKKTGTFSGYNEICNEDPIFDDMIRRWKESKHASDIIEFRNKGKEMKKNEEILEKKMSEEEKDNGIEFLGRANQRAPKVIVSIEEESEKNVISFGYLRFTKEQYEELVKERDFNYFWMKDLGEKQEAALQLAMHTHQVTWSEDEWKEFVAYKKQKDGEIEEKKPSTAIWSKEDWEEFVDYKEHFEENLAKMMEKKEKDDVEKKEREYYLKV
jgi:hypothetical protein